MKVVFSELMIAPAQGSSPSAAKPAPVVAAWHDLDASLERIAPIPVTQDLLALAHKHEYVEAVLSGREPNGFGTRSAEVIASLPYTSGAMLTAARHALQDRTAVAAPVSGFHHAGWDFGGGYCTFNGLMVAALALKQEGLVNRVGILDYDYHYGNGTDDIIENLNLDWVVHITAGATYHDADQALQFMTAISSHINVMANCDLVLYQAGADPHIDDPLGGFLTTTQLAQRDWRVFSGLHSRGIPVAWNLAGGYQKPLSKVIAIHENTYRAARAVYEP